jgi:ATP-dependent RNA helicase DHX36
MVEVTIELHEQGIRTVGKGAKYLQAERGAALRFKQEAQKYQAQHGEASIVIKDSTSLTASNSKKFLEFYKIKYPRATIRPEFSEALERKAFGNAAHRCQIFIDEQPNGAAAEAITKKAAEALACLTAAITLKEKNPELFPEFLQAWRKGHGDILKPAFPLDMLVDEDCILLMRKTLISARKAGLPDEPDESVLDEKDTETIQSRHLPDMTPLQAEKRNLNMQKAFGEYLRDARLDELRRKRSELPVNQYRAKVLDLIKNSTYSIIIGATGSGKTTQVPQIILEDAISKGKGSTCNIICTQPRRIAATSVARRVSDERGEPLQETVGYQIRFLSRLPKARGSITFCTTGILLRHLQFSPDSVMEDVSHLIIDEVHERDIQIDFLLVVLKKIMQQRAAAGRSTPKVVLMSATINTEQFASYFKDATVEGGLGGCPALNVPGRNFPVREKFLNDIVKELKATRSASDLRFIQNDPTTIEYFEANKRFMLDLLANKEVAARDTNQDEIVIDWKQVKRYTNEGELVSVSNEQDDTLVPFGLVAGTVAHIASQSNEGAILVFLPGLKEIMKVEELLKSAQIFGINFNDASKFKLIMLHSSIASAQTEVFNPVPPGCRKIILATNIAETSITIPDVQYVVDTGKLREKRYDQFRRITRLQCTWISKSNAKQRAGRAGRVQNGHYYALYQKERFDSMRTIGLPEILRSDLAEVCLDIKAQAFQSPIRDFLAAALEPPSPNAVEASIKTLEALDAITAEEKITPLGKLLASLPVHPSLGKMIVLGIIFRCLDPMVVLGAAVSERELFVTPLGAREQAHKAKLSFVQDSGSDHIAVLNAVRAMREQGLEGLQRQWQFSQRNFIHMNSYKTIEGTARQIEDILIDADIMPSTQPSARRCFEIGSPSLNQNSTKVPLIKSLLLAGLHPNLATSRGGKIYRTPGEQNAMAHPSSVNKPSNRKEEDAARFGTLLSYTSMRATIGSTTLLRDTTQSSPLMAILFGGKIQTDFHRKLEIDDWLKIYVKCNDNLATKTIFEFRKALERLLSMTFRRLTIKKIPDREDNLYLASEIVRETFSQGLVDILDRDLRVGDPVAELGHDNQWRWWPGVSQETGYHGMSEPTPAKWRSQSRWNGSTGIRTDRNVGWRFGN